MSSLDSISAKTTYFIYNIAVTLTIVKEITTDNAPPSMGPFSHKIRDGDYIYVSGQGPVDPDSGNIVGDTVDEETTRTLKNVRAILMEADCALDDIIKTTIFIQDMDDYDAVNEVYTEHMSAPYPARGAVEVADLSIDIDVEIEAIASAWEA